MNWRTRLQWVAVTVLAGAILGVLLVVHVWAAG